jgi:hypothetical protein
MRRKESSQIRLPSQCAHDLRDGQCGKNALGLQTERQYIGEHFDQQSGIQTIALELHRAHMENRFHDLPETLNHMMLPPDVPDFRTSQRLLTKVHQIVATSCTFPKKEENQRSKGGTLPPDATRRHVNTPCGRLQDQCFFPCQCTLFFPMNGKDIVAFARHDDLSKPSLMQPLSEFLRNTCRVHGQRQLSDIHPFTIKFVFELGQHEDQ